MERLLTSVTMSIGGGVGWWAGRFLGIGSALFLSVLGCALGLYVALKILR